MRIGILSDIHVDLEHPEPEKVIDGIAAAMEANAVEAMIIAGDVANDFRLTLGALRTLERLTGARVLFVPGNHDIWNEHHPHLTAWDIYEELREFPGNLTNGPQVLANGWVVIGDLGWYDYSFGGEYTPEEFDRMQIDGRLWQDKVKAVWNAPTLAVHAHFHAKLEGQLKRHPGGRTVLVTHCVPIRQFTVQPPDPPWDYLNAFLGSPGYGELAQRYAAAYSICGHVHYRREQTIGKTRFICNCLNYASQWEGNRDPRVEAARALKTIEL